jgi:hypothetical protein
VKDDEASENSVSRSYVDDLQTAGSNLEIEDDGRMVVETGNANVEDVVEWRQRLSLSVDIGSYVNKARLTIYDVKGFDIVLGKCWMHDINGWYHIDHDSNEMWVSGRAWENRPEGGHIHHLPWLRPQDVGDIQELARLLRIMIILQDELRRVDRRLLKRALFIRVYKKEEDPKPPDEMTAMLQGFGHALCSTSLLTRTRETAVMNFRLLSSLADRHPFGPPTAYPIRRTPSCGGRYAYHHESGLFEPLSTYRSNYDYQWQFPDAESVWDDDHNNESGSETDIEECPFNSDSECPDPDEDPVGNFKWRREILTSSVDNVRPANELRTVPPSLWPSG